MDAWVTTAEELLPATGSKVAIWLEDREGRISEGSYAESLCDVGADARGYWYDADGNHISAPTRWRLKS